MKRMYRNMSDEQKKKISTAKMGKVMPQSTRNRISQGLKRYWASIPCRPDEVNNTNNNEK